MAVNRPVKALAIVMIVYAVLSEVVGLLVTYSSIRLHFGGNFNPSRGDGDELVGYLIGDIFFTGIGLVSIFAAPFIVYGALQIWNGRNYLMARYAALATLVPLSSCLFIVGFPIGAWAMTVLARPDVKASFDEIDGGKANVS